MQINTIICGDCLEVMKDWPEYPLKPPESSVVDDMAIICITDPPYGVGLDYDKYDDTEGNWFAMMDDLLPVIKRITSMAIMPCCKISRLGWYYNNHKPDWIIAWYKGSPGTHGYLGFNDWEALLVYGKRKGIQMHDYFYCQPTPFEFGHPCPKPIKWAKWLIQRASKPNDLILDPFCGSGTTCVAAKMLGRRYIGIDISEKYCQITRQRLEAVDTGVPVREQKQGQQPLFPVKETQ